MVLQNTINWTKGLVSATICLILLGDLELQRRVIRPWDGDRVAKINYQNFDWSISSNMRIHSSDGLAVTFLLKFWLVLVQQHEVLRTKSLVIGCCHLLVNPDWSLSSNMRYSEQGARYCTDTITIPRYSTYTVKKVSDFPVPRSDVINQTLFD